MRKVIVFLATFWVIIYSNSRMLDYVPTYHVVHLFPISQPVRILELIIITFLYVLSLTKKMTQKILVINICILIYVGLSLFNLLLRWNLTLDGIQEIYVRVAPFLFFVVVAQGHKATKREWNYAIKFFSIVLFLNILIAVFYQIPFYGYYEDNINGFFEDAHMFGNYLALFSIVLFYIYLKRKRILFLLLSLTLLFISFFPSNEKVVLLNVIMIVVLFVYHLISKALGFVNKAIVVIGLATIALSGILYFQRQRGEELWVRADTLINTIGVQNVGPIVAWPMAFNEINSNVVDLLCGLGSGEYGWIAASRNVAEGKGSVHSRLFEFEFSNDNVNNAGFLFRTNTWSSLLAEYGIIGFLSFLIPLFLIIAGVRKYKSDTSLESNIKMVVFVLLLIVVYQGFFTPYSNWSASALMFPMMYFAAYFHIPRIKPEEKQTIDSLSIQG